MAYADFSLDVVEKTFGLITHPAELFPGLAPVMAPPWLEPTLHKGLELALISEKARSEFLVVPVLLAAREISKNRFAIYSGSRMDINPQQGLVGECDFILTKTPPVPVLRSPIVTIVEAKKNDIEGGFGQCAAEMVGAAQFNVKGGAALLVHGCVTTGETWQFLKLTDNKILIDSQRHYINQVELILAVLQVITQ